MMFSGFTRVVEYQQNLTFSSQIFHHVDINIVHSEAIIYSFIMVNNASLLHTISMGFKFFSGVDVESGHVGGSQRAGPEKPPAPTPLS